MASRETASTEILPSGEFDAPIDELEMKNRRDLENLTLAIQPIKTVQLFIFATCQYIRESVVYIFTRRVELLIMSMLIVAPSLLLVNADGPHEKLIHELFLYARFMLWWVALGVASSIGLGSGLHTFVLYLGPHIAFFTIKAMKCGRVDLKYAPYDTIQLKTGPSWLEKDCSEIGNPLFSSLPGSLVRVPLSSILPQVQLEAVLWGLGTALGELPPYFISRTAFLSGNKVDAVEDSDDASLGDDGFFSAFLRKMKRWILSHAQHLNFFTILILASVPNPLFDLAGIMCGQLGIPFWKFFLATLIGKAIIKTHIQTIFIISLCNNQLLEWMENELIWVLGHIPIISSLLPNLVVKLHMIQKKYLLVPSPTSVPDISDGMAKKWNLSFTMVWNTVIWLVLMNFLAKIVTTTAQSYLKKQQDLELHNRELSLKAKSEHTIQ